MQAGNSKFGVTQVCKKLTWAR